MPVFCSYPLVVEIAIPLTATEAFELFRDRPFSFFLDSGMDPQKLGRYSFLGSDPFLVLKSRGKEIALSSFCDGQETVWGNPFDILRELLERYNLYPVPLPLAGGVVGYFSYDLCHFVEHLPSTTRDDLGLPECYLAFYDAVVAVDHVENKVYVVSTGLPETEPGKRTRKAEERVRELQEILCMPLPRAIDPSPVVIPQSISWSSNFEHHQYLQAVETAREYIIAGDIFQVNLSQRFEATLPFSPYELYQRLRRINPAPFAAYLNFPEVSVVCASPERFLRLQGDLVETRPIKGTRPRGKIPAQDRALAEELLHSTKDRAEHVMIVDLERNDLGRVCRFGTVNVRELMTLETYATVFHLTSTVEGRLCPDKDRVDLLQACFPGGSITGAPKVRSMEIVDELEPTRRSIYTGSLGYLDFGGNMDLNIVIRTILAKGGKAYFQVGGGIVYDSDPESEYQETLDKADALFRALCLCPQEEVTR